MRAFWLKYGYFIGIGLLIFSFIWHFFIWKG